MQGINTGYCTVGNFGSEDRLDYTIVGGPVNAASRLESTAQTTPELISHDTYMLIKDEIYCRPMGEIKVKGIAHELRTYEVIALVDEMGAMGLPSMPRAPASTCSSIRLRWVPTPTRLARRCATHSLRWRGNLRTSRRRPTRNAKLHS